MIIRRQLTIRAEHIYSDGPRLALDTGAAWEWQDEAACASADVLEQLAFTSPPRMTGSRRVQDSSQALAERFCRGCPVKTQCFNWASHDPAFVGVAGGHAFSQSSASTRTVKML
jgi:Transcription factor WhiB